MRNTLAVALLALLGSANAQWKAERHFEDGGTSVNPIYRETRQLEQYYSAYRKNLKYICIFVNSCVPFFTSNSCVPISLFLGWLLWRLVGPCWRLQLGAGI